MAKSKKKAALAEVTTQADGTKVTTTRTKGSRSQAVTTVVERPKDAPTGDTGANGAEAGPTGGKAAKARTRAATSREGAKTAPDLEVLRRSVENAQSLVDGAEKEAARIQEQARQLLAHAKAAYREALTPYRDACRQAGVKSEFAGGRAPNVSDRVSFLVEKVAGGLKVAVRGRPGTEDVIPFAKLKVSIGKAATQYTDSFIGPRSVAGNKAGNVASCRYGWQSSLQPGKAVVHTDERPGGVTKGSCDRGPGVPTAGCERIDATMGQIVIECPSSLHAYIVSFPRILEIAPRACPVCAAGLKGHGCRHRWIVSLQRVLDVPIQRMRCTSCRRTFSLLPRILLPLVSCTRALRDHVRSLWVRGTTKMAAVRYEIASRSAGLSLSLSTLYRWASHTD